MNPITRSAAGLIWLAGVLSLPRGGGRACVSCRKLRARAIREPARWSGAVVWFALLLGATTACAQSAASGSQPLAASPAGGSPTAGSSGAAPASGASGAAPAPIPASAANEVPTLVIESNPTGAVVVLRGSYEWIGQTPWRLFRDLNGLYRVEARLPGYETWRGDVVLGPGAPQNLQIDLGRKTRLKAAVRSLFFPGWGQAYTGQTGKATFLVAAEVAALAGSVWAEVAYQNRVDDLSDAETALSGANLQNLSSLQTAYDDAGHRADRAFDRRRAAFGTVIGLHTFAVLDALLFHPSGRASFAGLGDRSNADLSAVEPAASTSRAAIKVALDPSGIVRAGLNWRW